MQSSLVGIPGPLAEHASGFAGFLAERGYAPSTASAHLYRLAELSRRLEAEGTALETLTAGAIEAIGASAPSPWTGRRARPYRHVAEYLSRCGALGRAEPVMTPVDELLADYRRWLRTERSLVDLTIKGYVLTASWFVNECCDGDRDRVLSLSPADVVAVVLRLARGYSPRTVNEFVVRLRSLFRYLYLEGLLEVPLAQATPWMAHGRASSLPRGLPPGRAELLLESCDRQSLTGSRDFAVLKVLIRLGLRRAEVAALGLDDVDWRRGELDVPGKGGFRDPLPLPVDVGEALATYLELRAEGECRKLFCHVRAPRGGVTPSDVSAIVARACERVDVQDTGTHRLRHAVATDMLRRGAPLYEIGQVLRHRDVETTAIYAKVDTAALSTLARPWPRSGK
jgi:integrase/recombinase XerD